MSHLLREHLVSVACKGSLVVLQVGNLHYSIEFDLALTIAAMLKHESRVAKLNAGDFGRHRHCLAVMHDASAPQPKRKRFIEKLPELLKARNIEVKAKGQIVELSFGSIHIGLPHQVAREISQWLRLRGKEAKGVAGERSHWSDVVRSSAPAIAARVLN